MKNVEQHPYDPDKDLTTDFEIIDIDTDLTVLNFLKKRFNLPENLVKINLKMDFSNTIKIDYTTVGHYVEVEDSQ